MSSNVNWNKIESILLDLDGTLLDLNFDLHFWLEYIPKVYSEKHNIPRSFSCPNHDLAVLTKSVASPPSISLKSPARIDIVISAK